MKSNLIKTYLPGALATVPMTATMAIMHRWPTRDPKALPPQRVARGIANKLHFNQKMNSGERSAFTWISHFGFGATTGALFAKMSGKHDRHALSKGIGFGLFVWGASYMGWLPALGITSRPDHEPKQQVASQIVSHIVWGACLGYLVRKMHAGSK